MERNEGGKMKLRNKKTGEIVKVESLDVDTPTEGIVGIPSFDRKGSYSSLAELNEEWEDAPEEPKRFYWLDYNGDIYNTEIGTMDRSEIKEIGNLFETKEEAEQAVEKLKAWKRLKDKGFRFYDWKDEPTYRVTFEWSEDIKVQEIQDDLNLLFGGEE